MEKSGFERYGEYFEIIEKECNEKTLVYKGLSEKFATRYKHFVLEEYGLHVYKTDKSTKVSKNPLNEFAKREDEKNDVEVYFMRYEPEDMEKRRYSMEIEYSTRGGTTCAGKISYSEKEKESVFLPGQEGNTYIYMPYTQKCIKSNVKNECVEKLTSEPTSIVKLLEEAIENSKDQEVINNYNKALELFDDILKLVDYNYLELEQMTSKELENYLKEVQDANDRKREEIKRIELINKIKEEQQEGKELDNKIRDAKIKKGESK